MTLFRNALIAMIVALVMITIAAVAREGIDLLTPYFGAIFALTWQGQFNADFGCYIILSGVWMAWRSGFSKGGLALGIFAAPLGILFFGPYLIYLIGKTSGDPLKLLLGVHVEHQANG